MEDFEQQLKDALTRKEAPEWFEAKVLGATRGLSQRRTFWQRLAGNRLRWASAAAAVVVLAGGLTLEHERAVRERAAGEAAKARLELALRITSVKLHKIEEKLNQVERDN